MNTNSENKFLLKVDDLTVQRVDGERIVTLVDGLSFEMVMGETIGLVGESGSGKTLTALALMGLLPENEGWKISGRIQFGSIDINTASASSLTRIRGRKLAMIFQEPANALHPVMTCGRQIAEVLRTHFSLTKSESRPAVIRLLHELEFENPIRVFNSYPHELSGGMRQRILIAMALAGEPSLMIADEPTSMLDPENQLQAMRLIRKKISERLAGLIFISHDLSLLTAVDTIIVMYASRIAEYGTSKKVLNSPNHPYTQKLLALTQTASANRLPVIPGSILSPEQYYNGCHFFGRCEYAMPVCQQKKPLLAPVGDLHYSACLLNEK